MGREPKTRKIYGTEYPCEICGKKWDKNHGNCRPCVKKVEKRLCSSASTARRAAKGKQEDV